MKILDLLSSLLQLDQGNCLEFSKAYLTSQKNHGCMAYYASSHESADSSGALTTPIHESKETLVWSLP